MTGEELFNRLQKPGAKVKVPKPLKQLGKVGKQRLADRKAKLKAEPADYRGMRQCYLCSQWFAHVDVEHVKDASTHPELRHDPTNHRWSCNPCNLAKKNPPPKR